MIVSASPLWTVLIEAVRPGGNRPTKMTSLGVLVGLAGIFILIDPMWAGGQGQPLNLLGVAALLLAALSWSIGSIYSHTAKLPKSGLLGTGMELITGGLGCYLLGIISGEASRLQFSAIHLSSLAGLGYLIVIGSLLGFVCYTWLLRVAPTSLVVTHAYVNPLVAVVLGSLVANEALTPKVFLAAPLILSAVLLIHMKPVEKKAAERTLVTLPESAGDD
jgi:drug/metabolite transporter (DMT)-like permease